MTATGDPINPAHYKAHPSGIECIEVTRHCSFDLGNAIKYIWRFADKGGHEDLRKARWYLADVLATGQASYPPHKARKLLNTATQAEAQPDRAKLLALIAAGQLTTAIEHIDRLVRDG
ncbi:hypothetical protein BMG05_15005 [Mycobacterium malmoense]|nr:hypothetical protein BMG05_15005 [Mycobacterium malmoense]